MNKEHGTSTVPAPPRPGDVPVLQKLSSPPFPRSGFPLLGILASIYEHVTSVAGRSPQASASAESQPPVEPGKGS